MNMILASASPRRKELLKKMGMEFVVFPAQGEEVITKEAPRDIVVELAQKKAQEIYEKTVATGAVVDGSVVIGADTMVFLDEVRMGKPKDEKDAYEMLEKLQGRTHEVYTGVSIWFQENGNKIQYSFYEKTEVTMYRMSEKEINSYIATGDPMDKAGAYGIQGDGALYIEKINGDYNNVVGLPVARIYHEMRQLGLIEK